MGIVINKIGKIACFIQVQVKIIWVIIIPIIGYDMMIQIKQKNLYE